MLRAVASGAPSIRVGRLDTRRDFTDVRDVVRAYRLILQAGVRGDVYNVCSGVDRSIADIAAAIMSRLGTHVELVPDADLQRPSDLPVLRGDNTKICQATAWAPVISFEESIAAVVDDLSDRQQAS